MTLLDGLAPARRAAKANLLPGLILQAFALLIIFGYLQSAEIARALDRVGRLKNQHGYLFAGLSTAFFGGLVPYLVLLARGRIRPAARVRELAFYLLFWGYKGLEVDALYRFQGFVFGSEASAAVIGAKVAFDQFVYNPLWAAPSQTLAFAWKDAGFSAEGLRMRLRESSLRGSVLVVLLATWVVWIPAVAIIYSLPAALQVPLFNLVLCFWCLLLSFVSRNSVHTESVG